MKTRIAPSPTGYLHLGHAYSAWLTKAIAQHLGLEVILRIEDIDHTRCRPEYVNAIAPDLEAIGITSEAPVLKQSERFAVYAKALQKLDELGLIYPCTCTRAEVDAHATQTDHGPIYPGTCRERKVADMLPNTPFALRLNVEKSLQYLKQQEAWPLTFTDAIKGKVIATPEVFGDVVLARKEFPTSYHLSVVCDDAAQNITHIIRGADLYEMTHIHRLLQALLGFNAPTYIHHGLIIEEGKQKLSKSAAASALHGLIKKGLPTADLEILFNDVKTIADEPGQKFIDALPQNIAEGLVFKPFS